jgi:hypothetical protein
MEAVMLSSITRVLMPAAVAMAVAGAVGNAGAQPPVERLGAMAQEAPSSHYEAPLAETQFRLRDHQQLRRILLGN